jgi:galactokinase
LSFLHPSRPYNFHSETGFLDILALERPSPVPAQNPLNPVPEFARQFQQLFGAAGRFVQAPGRVNLIGEHTDYNDGFVLPAAIPLTTKVGFRPRSDGRLALYSENYTERITFELGDLPSKSHHHWSDYVVGVARKLQESGIRLAGADLLIVGNVPQGAGLSSSASLEVAICFALLEISGEKMTGANMAKLCQSAENDFVGARCGIMDQFVSVHGKRDHALLLDCRSLAYEQRPIPDNVRLAICNTMVRHALASGEYNERRRECEEGARFFAKKIPAVGALRDVALDDLSKYGDGLPRMVRKRCQHVITEIARVGEAAEALRQKDTVRFGRLMRESHASLRDDFEVSCRELDIMVELASEVPGVFGARMTGGGFGGCTINLVESDQVEAFESKVTEGYEKAVGIRPEVYVCTAADGVRVLE